MPPRSKRDRTREGIAFGKRVRELRTAKNWTQEALAERADMNWLQVGHIERGASDPKVSTIMKLAKALGVPPGELVHDWILGQAQGWKLTSLPDELDWRA